MSNDTTELSLASLELDKLEACVELMFFTAYADGVVDAAERKTFAAHVLRATRGQLRPELIQAVLEQIERRMKTQDRRARVEALAQRMPDTRMRRAVLLLAATVAMADGKLSDGERAFLEEMGEVFGVAKEEVAKLVVQVSAP